MQRSSDQAAVCRMQENSSDQCVTLEVVMGLPLPNGTTENREVLFHSISSCLSGRSNWKWLFCYSQIIAVLRILHMWELLIEVSVCSAFERPQWQQVLEDQSSTSACTSVQVTHILPSVLDFYLLLCAFTALSVKTYLNGISMYTKSQNCQYNVRLKEMFITK